MNRATDDARRDCFPPVVGKSIVVAGLGLYVAAFLVVILGNDGLIRYTADGSDTIPVWHPLLPAVIGGALVWLVSPVRGILRPAATADRYVRIEAIVLLTLAVAFAVLLSLLGPNEPRYTLLKLTLLLAAPLALFAITRHRARASRAMAAPSGDYREVPQQHSRRQCWRPLLPAAGWAMSYLILSASRPKDSLDFDVPTLVIILVGGFLINAVMEEFFYRKWLQTRWARLLGGMWPAIILSSILWASWHVGIQGEGNLVKDLANVIVNQGVTGLFLGLLWTRYRMMWPLLIVHGLMNANPVTMLGGPFSLS